MSHKKTAAVLVSFILMLMAFFLFHAHKVYATEESGTIPTGTTLAHFTLTPPNSKQEKQYLGLEGTTTPFTLSEISTRFIVLEFFSVYCPHCRLQAPQLNKVYNLIQQNKEASDNIRMMGIATGAEKDKVEKWKNLLQVQFPIFVDKDTEIWKTVGKPAVPCTLLLNPSGKVLMFHNGVTEDTEKLFLEIKGHIK